MNATTADTMNRLQLFAKWERLAYLLALRHWRRRADLLQARGMELDDIRQIALLVLWDAADKYDPTRGISFGTYLGVAFWRNMLRIEARQFHFNELSDAATDSLASRADKYGCEVGREQLDDVTARRLDALPRKQREALLRNCAGESQTKIARQLGVSKEAIRHRISKAIRAIRGGRTWPV